MKELKRLLLEKGIKPTYQRIKVLEYLNKNKNHPTVDMIYVALYKKVPTLSRTTVYNTLDAFSKNGLVNVLTITGSELRYDSVINPHHHFLCKVCGNIIDIDIECPNARKVEAEGGHRIDEVHGYFKGVCASCLKKQNKGGN